MKYFSCKTQIFTGAGSLSRLGQLNIRRMFLVTDPYFFENGTAQRLPGIAGAQACEIFHRVTPDPTVTLAAEGTARLKAFAPDWVVALGGGSAIDCAKAMVYFSEQPIPLAAIPTTSGSGSEVTDFSVLTHNGVKHPLVDERICPQVAILDGDLLEKLPPSLIADTGFDVLSHALEAFVATGATTFSDALSADAFAAALTLLPESYNGNLSARQPLHEAATMAGLAFNQAGLGLCHAMAHALGGTFHIPHGRLNSILLPQVITCNTCSREKYAQLARRAGLGGTADTIAVRNLTNALIHLRKQLQLPATLQEAGVAPRQVWEASGSLVADVLADPCCNTNPLPVTEAVVRRVLGEVTGRG